MEEENAVPHANIHGVSVGDGREEARESTLAGKARPAEMTVFGARRVQPKTPPPVPNAVQHRLHGTFQHQRSGPPPPFEKPRMGEEKTLWLRQESVIRSFVSHSLTV